MSEEEAPTPQALPIPQPVPCPGCGVDLVQDRTGGGWVRLRTERLYCETVADPDGQAAYAQRCPDCGHVWLLPAALGAVMIPALLMPGPQSTT